MRPVEYVFRIDAFSPETLPMARLAEYLAALSKMLGHSEHTHFVRVDPGSAKLVHRVDAVDAPKVETRLNGVRLGDAPKDALAAYRLLDDLLANDNATGTLTEAATDKLVVPFTGRNRPKALTFPPFRQNTSLDGQLVSIGGRDDTAHAILQDGATYYAHLSMKRALARELAKLLYGPVVRLHGNGRFERAADGVWKLLDFRVDTFEILDDRSVRDVVKGLRGMPDNGLMSEDAYSETVQLRRLGDQEL